MSAPGARDFAEVGGVMLDPEINFPGLTGAFESATGKAEHTTARWTGRIEAPESGDCTVAASGDNGFRLFVDGNVAIDHWEPDWDNEQTGKPVALTTGEPHESRLGMFQDTGGANMFLRWPSAKLKKQIVPESAFTPPAGFDVYPVALGVAEDGLELRATLDEEVTDLGAVKDHLKIEADTSPMPVKSVAKASGNPKALVIALGAPVRRAGGSGSRTTVRAASGQAAKPSRRSAA